MKSKYLFGLMAASGAFAAFSLAALVLFLTHSQFRRTVGQDTVSFDKFQARVEGGSFTPETMTRFTNSWFEAQKQDHQIIQMEETVSDRLAHRVFCLGLFGFVAVAFQSWLLLSLRGHLKGP